MMGEAGTPSRSVAITVRREEEAYLCRVLGRIPERIEEIDVKLKKIERDPYSTGTIKRSLVKGLLREQDQLRAIGDAEPYFGRIDVVFLDDPEAALESRQTFYLGKTRIAKDDSDNLVIDFREAVGSLYYQAREQGRTSFRAPGGPISVDFLGKRSYEIKSHSLIAIYDGFGNRIDLPSEPVIVSPRPKDGALEGALGDLGAIQDEATAVGDSAPDSATVTSEIVTVSESPDTVTGRWRDPLLSQWLEERHPFGHLSDIYRTIQAEQDKVIRSHADVLVVQGPAGSGKTICALQRAAQLLYDRRKQRREAFELKGIEFDDAVVSAAKQMLVFSPNAVFSDYISRVLPDLNEDEIQQAVLEEYLRRLLFRRLAKNGSDERRLWKVEKRRDRYEALLAVDAANLRETAALYKGSLALLDELESYVATVKTSLTATAFSSDILLDGYHSSDTGSTEGIFFSASAQAEQFTAATALGTPPSRAFEDVVRAVRERQADYSARRFVEDRTKARLGQAIDQWLAKARDSARRVLHLPLVVHYERFWSERGKATQDAIVSGAASTTLTSLRSGEILCEDVIPLLLLDSILHGAPKEYEHLEHVIVDEAQDYSPLHYEFIRRLLPHGCGVTIVGDVHQGIDPSLSLRDWKQVGGIFGATHVMMAELKQSYRSSQEITNLAAAILGGDVHIENMRRSGVRPRLLVLPAKAKERYVAECVIDAALQLRAEAPNRSVGVLCRTGNEVGRVMRLLQKRGVKALALTDTSRTLSGGDGLVVAPLYLAKGLEFDSVVVANVSASAFAGESDRRALYTACTRPQHELVLVSGGEPSPLLPPPAEDDRRLYDRIDVTLGEEDGTKESEEDGSDADSADSAEGEDLEGDGPVDRLQRPIEENSVSNDAVGADSVCAPTPSINSMLSPLPGLPPDRLQIVLRQAYGMRERLSAKQRAWLSSQVRPVPGFQMHPLKAPFEKVAMKLTRVALRADLPEAGWRLLALWRLSHSALEAQVRVFLSSTGVDVVADGRAVGAGDGASAPAIPARCAEWAAAFQNACADSGQDTPGMDDLDVFLMVSALATGDKEAVTHLLPPNRWEALLAPWVALAANAPEWDCINDFVACLGSLAEERRHERQREEERLEAEQDFGAALQRLADAEGEGLCDFGIALPGAPLTGRRNSEQLREAAAQVNELRVLLEEYRGIDWRGAPVADRPALRERHAALEQAIPAVAARLTQVT